MIQVQLRTSKKFYESIVSFKERTHKELTRLMKGKGGDIENISFTTKPIKGDLIFVVAKAPKVKK